MSFGAIASMTAFPRCAASSELRSERAASSSSARILVPFRGPSRISAGLVPKKDGRGRVPACEVLINTAAVADNIRDIEKALNIPDLIAQGTVSYGMQNFDQSLMTWYKSGVVSYDDAIFFSSNPSEFALRASGIEAASDRTFTEITGGGAIGDHADLS